MIPDPPNTRRPGRIDAVDAARGASLLAMAAYHAIWDAGFVGLTPVNLALTGPGRDAARLIAGTFLMLSGVGLVLAHRGGVRPRPFLRRLALVTGAALAVTLATRLAFPEGYVFFGILHCIAVTGVLALPFLRAPVALTLAASVAAFAAPLVLAGPAFDAPLLAFLGLGTRVPVTNDYVPLLPWFGAVLAGVAAARLARPAGERRRLLGRAWRPLLWAGRHSLAIYLVHQPVLFALAWGIAAVAGPHPRAGEAAFRASFGGECARAGGSAGACAVASRCAVVRLREAGLWAGPTGLRAVPEERARATAIARDCFEAATADSSEPSPGPGVGTP